MQLFSIYTSKNNKDDIVALKEGFSIQAFIFGPLWALYKQMWLIGSINIIIYIILIMLKSYIPEFLSDLLNNILFLSYGFFASDLLSYRLSNNNYDLQDVVIANNKEQAELTFLKK